MTQAESLPLQQIDAIVRQGRRQELGRQLLLGFFGVMGLAGVCFTLWLLATRAPAPGEVLAGVLTQAVSLVMLGRLWLGNQRLRRRYAELARPGAETIRRALEEVRREIRRQRLLRTVLALVVGPLFGVSLLQLVGNGKMKVIEALWAGSFIAVLVVMIVLIVRHRLQYQLEPRRRQLERLDRQLEEI